MGRNSKHDYIKSILEVIYGNEYKTDKSIIWEVMNLYGPNYKQDVTTMVNIDRIDLAKITLFACFFQDVFARQNFKQKSNSLERILKSNGKKYIKKGEGKVLFITDENKEVTLINSDINLFHLDQEELEETYTEEERGLLKGYCRTLPFKVVFSCFVTTTNELQQYLNTEETKPEVLYMKLIKVAKRYIF